MLPIKASYTPHKGCENLSIHKIMLTLGVTKLILNQWVKGGHEII